MESTRAHTETCLNARASSLPSKKILNPDEGHPYYFLGGALALLAALYPILSFGQTGLIIWSLTFWVVLVAAIYVTGRRRNVRRLARTLGGLALVAGVIGLILGDANDIVTVIVDVLTLVFLLFATGAVLYEVFLTYEVDVDHLIGAAASYVLLGLTFTYAFMTLQLLSDASLLASQTGAAVVPDSGPGLAEFLYFSFVTLTTLGFGDIIPVTPSSRVLTTTEAIVGQLFLAILIARLMGLHIAHASGRFSKK